MLTHAYVREMLHYSIITGQFYWIKPAPGRRLSKEVGTTTKKEYRQICLLGKLYLSHRLAWFWVTGEWPQNEIDHKNGVKDANQWINIREATRAENNWNKGVRSNNKTGYKGVNVRLDKYGEKWVAKITINKKYKYLGLFKTPELAHEAYRAASVAMCGEFFNTTTRANP